MPMTSSAQEHRVLVVDDDDDIREVACLSLTLVGGMETVTASDGREALQVAGREPVDAILLDMMMPVMDGPTTIRQLKTDPATAPIPVILLTAKLQPMHQDELKGLDVAGTIAKPFDPMTLSQQISNLLGWAQ